MKKITIGAIILAIFVARYFLITQQKNSSIVGTIENKICKTDLDCVVFGKTGDCNCGCYNKNNLPSRTGGECFCAAPTSCDCINDQCEGVFE